MYQEDFILTDKTDEFIKYSLYYYFIFFFQVEMEPWSHQVYPGVEMKRQKCVNKKLKNS